MEGKILSTAKRGVLDGRSRQLGPMRDTLPTREVDREAATGAKCLSARVGRDIAEGCMICLGEEGVS